MVVTLFQLCSLEMFGSGCRLKIDEQMGVHFLFEIVLPIWIIAAICNFSLPNM